MERMLALQGWLWGLLPLVLVLVVATLRQAIRDTRHPSHDLSARMQRLARHTTGHPINEHTVSRWARIVKQSNTAFWTHVSQRQDPRA